jgi:hypothetical protein
VAIASIFYAGAASEVLPAIAGLKYGRALPSARRWIVVWSLILVASSTLMLIFAMQRRNNHWVSFVSNPFRVAAILMALSCWHSDAIPRLVLRYSIIPFVVIWCLLVFKVESFDQFSLLTGPFRSLLLLTASLGTLLLLVRHEEDNLLRKDWFWICGGLSLSYGTDVALEPLSRRLVESHAAMVVSAYQIKMLIDIVVSLIITRGMLCPIPPRSSGGPLSPVSSPSRSSFSRSAPPSSSTSAVM